EPDSERIGFQKGAGGDHAGNADTFLRPALPRPLSNEGKEIAFERLPDLPQLLVRNGDDSVPQARVIVAIHPLSSEVAVEQTGGVVGEPGGYMNPVSDSADRPVLIRQPRPDRTPHRPRYRPVELTDGVDFRRRAHRKGRHVELCAGPCIVGTECE